MSKVLYVTCSLYVIQDGNVIGFDAEWKPMMCRAGQKE